MKPPSFNQAEFAATLDRMKGGTDHSLVPFAPRFDPILRREVQADAIAGRKIDDYHRALESQGFMFWSPERLPPLRDGRVRTEGEWRNRRLRMGFTDSDILTMFPGGPQEFFEWCNAQKLKLRIQASRR
jgi:hypothetical protein